MRFLDGFSHNLEPELLANSRHDLPALIAQPLEHVRRRSRFPNTATKKTRTALLDNFCNGEGLLAALDRARPGDDCQLAVANHRIAGADNRFVGSQIECDQFVRLRDADDLRNTGQVFKTSAIDWAVIARDADRRA